MREEFTNYYRQDLELMQQMGVNTVRVYVDFGDRWHAILDECFRRGIMVIMTVAISRKDLEGSRSFYLDLVERYQNHPAILMWSLGHEWDLNHYDGYSTLQEAASATSEAAKKIKQQDPHHPVTTAISGTQIASVVSLVPTLDIWGLNLYRGASFGDLFTAWKGMTPKPFYLSEFGTDSFMSKEYRKTDDGQVLDVTGTTDERRQADFTLALWREIFPHLSAYDPQQSCLGGLVHEFNDELWKSGSPHVGLGRPPTYYLGPDGRLGTADDPTSYDEYDADGFHLAGAHPDDVENVEYFGIVDADRKPKLIYDALKRFYTGYQTGIGQAGDESDTFVTVQAATQSLTRPPVLEKIGNLAARVGIPMCIAPAASDPDKHELVYSFTSHNPESQIHEDATLNPTTGRFCWTARAQDAGKAYDVTLTVTQKQAGGLSASERFTIRVESTIPEQKPMFTKVPDQTVVEGDTVAFTVKAVDPDGGKIVSYDWAKPLRPGESVKTETDPSDGNLILKYRWDGANHTLSPNGKYLLTFSATDDEGEIAVLEVNLDVAAKPQPKLVFHPDLIDRTLAEGETVSFPILQLPEETPGPPKAVTACAASDIPLGVTMGNNQFQWTPQAGQAGTYPITFTCHGAEIISKTITITVTVGPLTAPQTVQAKAISSTEVEVAWNLPQQSGTGFELTPYRYRDVRDTASAAQEAPVDLPATATSYHATQLRPETKYEYVVCTYDTVENQRRKVCANGVSATTPANQPPTSSRGTDPM